MTSRTRTKKKMTGSQRKAGEKKDIRVKVQCCREL